MSDRPPHEDELSRRRVRKVQAFQPGEELVEEIPKLGWRDVLALTIAAYQVLFPILAVMVGVLLVVYLLFRLLFH